MNYNFSINRHNKCMFISINMIKSNKLENIEYLFEKELTSKEYSKLYIKGLISNNLSNDIFIQKIREIINLSKSTNNILVCNSESLDCIINILKNSTLDNLINNIYILDLNMIIKEVSNLESIKTNTKISILSKNKLISKNQYINIFNINYNSNKNKIDEIIKENIFNDEIVIKELNNLILKPKTKQQIIQKKFKIKIIKPKSKIKMVKLRKTNY